jgi:hypothetical protein
MQFPGEYRIHDPVLDLCYEIEIGAKPREIWPWIVQMGYHRGGWYIDTWWDRAIQEHFWPRVVPKNARGSFKPPTSEILPEYQSLRIGDSIPDGPPGSAFYEVIDLHADHILLLYSTSHFKYAAPRFVYKTRFAPRGGFCWAFILNELLDGRTKLISWWQAEIYPRKFLFMIKPFFRLLDGVHQREILKGIKRRVENYAS